MMKVKRKGSIWPRVQRNAVAMETKRPPLVGGDEQLVRHGEAKRPGSLSIDHQLQFARLHDRQVRGFDALEDVTGIYAHLTIGICQACSIAHEPADLGILTPRIYRGDSVTRC